MLIKRKRIESLITASVLRRDGKNLLDIVVHKGCNTNYTRESSISAALKNNLDDDDSPSARSLRSDGFLYEQWCCICGGDASDTFIESQKYSKIKVTIHHIKKISVCQTLIDKLKNSSDTNHNAIYHCLKTAPADLVQAKARYHHNCYSKLFLNPPKHSAPGRPASPINVAFTNFVCNYIKVRRNECQFLFSEIYSKFKAKHKYAEEPNFRQVVTNVKEFFKDDLIVTKKNNDIYFIRTWAVKF